MRIYVETYGCSANLNNAEIIRGILAKKHKIVDSENKADLIILNTCIVKGPTENKMIRRIQDIKKELIVTGCMPDAEPEVIKRINPKAICVGINNIRRIDEAVEAKKDILGKEREIKLNCPKINANRLIEIIQICEGCLGNCAYCITKLAKGNLFSYPEDKIVREIEKSSAKEIWLTSQDCAAYGIDKNTNLAALLKKITAVKKDFKLRIGMMTPNNVLNILDDLIEIYKNPRVFKFLHIPVQSGNNVVLKKMNRLYTVEEFKQVIMRFREEIPEIQIMTDIICGFPSETEEQFDDSIKLMKETRPDNVHVSRYWPMKKTKAAEMKQVSDKKIRERSKRMDLLVRKISAETNKKWVGRKDRVFVDEEINKGRNNSYRQVIVKSKENLLGKEIDVKIVDSTVHGLIAQ